MRMPQSEEGRVPRFNDPGVTKSYLGVWKRKVWIDSEGNRDEVTNRYWLQTGDWHADLSIGQGRPDFTGIDSVTACSVSQLKWLGLHQQGFCGITRLNEDLCQWDRQHDSSLRNTPDIGRMRFEGDIVHERGVLDPLYECWERLPGSEQGSSFVLQGVDAVRGIATVLLVQGSYFMYLRERQTAPIRLLAIHRRLCAGVANRDDLERFVDFELSLGCIQAVGWSISHSTLPWRENTLFKPAAPTAH
ncbi:MAG: hypothetical protein NXH81_01380 [Halieaceae bacterium]|uniref:hypothetical protein n=1 Tax=Haliea alexandrii TaxID=2448162 RepID=UPI000F0B6F75|nr:hypothetical protein [Haliea alexandrii]MCR9184027.1 hypothetical protein [Halieaceae bacterium]